MQLPGELSVQQLPYDAQTAFRLTCRTWRDSIKASELSGTVDLKLKLNPEPEKEKKLKQSDWQEKATKLKSEFPNAKINICSPIYQNPEVVKECMQALESPECSILTLQCRLESRTSTTLQYLQLLGHFAAASKRHVQLQLEFTASCSQLEEPQAAGVSEAFQQILPFITGLTITDGFSTRPENMYSFSHLSRLELTLPDAKSPAVTSGEAVQKLPLM